MSCYIIFYNIKLKRRFDHLVNLIDPLLDHQSAGAIKHIGILLLRTNGWINSRI